MDKQITILLRANIIIKYKDGRLVDQYGLEGVSFPIESIDKLREVLSGLQVKDDVLDEAIDWATQTYEEDTRRTPQLQAFLDELVKNIGLDQDTIAASEHPYDCRCGICLAWWARLGPDGEPDDEGAWGPFTRTEIEAYKERKHA